MPSIGELLLSSTPSRKLPGEKHGMQQICLEPSPPQSCSHTRSATAGHCDLTAGWCTLPWPRQPSVASSRARLLPSSVSSWAPLAAASWRISRSFATLSASADAVSRSCSAQHASFLYPNTEQTPEDLELGMLCHHSGSMSDCRPLNFWWESLGHSHLQ